MIGDNISAFSADEMQMHSLASTQTVQPYELVCAKAELSRRNYAQIAGISYRQHQKCSHLCRRSGGWPLLYTLTVLWN